MFLDLKACYSPSDLVFVVALFILTLFATGAFLVLMAHLVKGVWEEVKLIRKQNTST